MMPMRVLRRVGLSLLICAYLLTAVAGVALALQPFHVTQYVTDQAQILSVEQQNQLETVLADYDKQSGNQLLVITIPSLGDEELVSFTEKLFELNKPGEKGKDNGLIFLVALKERQIRIETGYGLEEAIPDGRAGNLIRTEIVPRFKKGDYYNGIAAGVVNLIHYISPEYHINLNNTPVQTEDRSKRNSGAEFIFIIIIVIMVMVFGNYNQQIDRRRYRRGYSEPTFWGGPGFSGRGFGGGSGGGFGGGGFSGGGGSFGGGGSSGSW